KCRYKTCGHLEEVVSGSALDRAAKKFFGNNFDSKTLFELYRRKKDPKAVEIIEEFLLYLGMSIANIISFFDPDTVIIGGGVGENKDIIIPKVSQIVQKYVQPYIAKKVKILPSVLGNKAGLYGAMWLPVINTTKKQNYVKV
ncbi:MAG: ROK family protein, partial [Endomicrobia bacterium]|nr:ROK family protein [Endomicrobiia bacterium]